MNLGGCSQHPSEIGVEAIWKECAQSEDLTLRKFDTQQKRNITGG